MDEYIKTHTIKNMNDMQEMIGNMFGPALQKMLDAEMEAKLGYAKNEKNDTTNSRNGYYKERNINTTYGEIPVSIPRDRLGECKSDFLPPYAKSGNGFAGLQNNIKNSDEIAIMVQFNKKRLLTSLLSESSNSSNRFSQW